MSKITREVLFGSREQLDGADLVEVIEIGSRMLKVSKDTGFLLRTISFCLSNYQQAISETQQIYGLFKKWNENDNTQVRAFILSELSELVVPFISGKLEASLFDAPTTKVHAKKELKKYGKQIKKALEDALIKKYGDEYSKKVSVKLKIKENAIYRFFREDRVPREKYILALMKLLGLVEITYFK